jgi:O-antigen ligase
MESNSPESRKPFGATSFNWGLALLGFSLPLSLAASEAIASLLLAIFLVRLIQEQKIPFSLRDLPIFAFILIRLSRALLSPHPELIGKGLTYLAFFVAYVFTAWSPEGRKIVNWRNFVRGLVLGGVIDSVAGLYQVADGAFRGIGLSGGWTVFGNMTGAALILGVYFALHGGLFPRRYQDVLAITLNAAGLAASVCRAEWVAAVLVLLPAAFMINRRVSLILGGSILALFLMITPLRQRLLTIADPVKNLSGRDFIWKAAVKPLHDHPLIGNGLNSFHAVFPRGMRPWLIDTGPGDWHNLYLQVTLENGLIGLAILLWMMGSALYLAIKRIRIATSDLEKGTAWGLFCVLGFFLIAGGLSVFLVRIGVVILVCMILGMINRRDEIG